MSRPPSVSNSFKSRQIEVTDQLILGNGIRSTSPDNQITITGNISATGTMVIDTSSSNAALRITQRGEGNVIEFEDSDNPDSTPLVVNNVGQIISGATTAFSEIAGLQLTADSASAPNGNIHIRRCMSFAANAPAVILEKTRGTASARQSVIDGDGLGNITWVGFDGTDTTGGARIRCFVDGTVSANSIPTRLTFETIGQNLTSFAERMRITSAGNVGISTTVPNERLTVIGNISATGAIYAQGPILSGGIDLFNIFTTGAAASGIQNLSFNEGNFNLSISEGNTVSLTALADTTSIAAVSSNLTTTISAVSSTLNTTIVNLTAALPSTINTYLSTNNVTINALTVTTGLTAQSANIPVTVIDLTASKTFNDSDTNKVFHFNTATNSLCAIIPDSLSNGFNVAILNTETNSLVISAANLKSFGTTIVDQYGGAYIYKQNNDIFAVGRLF